MSKIYLKYQNEIMWSAEMLPLTDMLLDAILLLQVQMDCH